MNCGFGIFDPARDDGIDRGNFCQDNEEENDILDKIDREREERRIKQTREIKGKQNDSIS